MSRRRAAKITIARYAAGMSERRPTLKFQLAGLALVAIGVVLFLRAHAAEPPGAHAGSTDLRWLAAGACTVVGLLVGGIAFLARKKPED